MYIVYSATHIVYIYIVAAILMTIKNRYNLYTTCDYVSLYWLKQTLRYNFVIKNQNSLSGNIEQNILIVQIEIPRESRMRNSILKYAIILPILLGVQYLEH